MSRATLPSGGTVVLPSPALTITSFSADMAVDNSSAPTTLALQTANEHNPAVKLPDHALSDKILNALTLSAPGRVAQSLYVEFFWQTTGATGGASFKCQVNLEEIGGSGPSKDVNVAGTAVSFVAGTSDYKDVVKVDIGTAAGNLQPGLYTVSALFFVDISGSTGLGAFAEVGHIMIA